MMGYPLDKVNYRKKLEGGTIRESWLTPEGNQVEAVTTVHWNAVANRYYEEDPYRDPPHQRMRDIPSSQDNYGNTTGTDVPPMHTQSPDVHDVLSVPPGYRNQYLNDPLGNFNDLASRAAPKKMRINGEELDILVPRFDYPREERFHSPNFR